jgi:phosphatidylserine/phosphatidylglycerophosphate/cardiolipin synthase-like enzyme
MTGEEPPYLGSWKGRVLEALAVYNVRYWDNLLVFTELTPDSLNTALSELFDLNILTITDDGGYWVEESVYHQYRSFFVNVPIEEDLRTQAPSPIPKEVLLEDENIARWVRKWRDFKNLTFSLDARHFFLEGTYLDDLSKDLIRQAKHEVLIVNPYIEQCHLSNTLIDPIANHAKVIVVTRHFREDDLYLKEKQAYHEYLQKEGVQFHYNRRIHAKLLVVDKRIAVISSMNFIVQSSGGSSWEAGMISIDEAIVKSVTKTIYELLERIE